MESLSPSDFDMGRYLGTLLLIWFIFVVGIGVVLMCKPGSRWDVPLLVAGILLQALFVLAGLRPWTWTAEQLADPGPWIFAIGGTGIVVMNALSWSLRCPLCQTRGIRRGIEDGPFRAPRRKLRGPCRRCMESTANRALESE